MLAEDFIAMNCDTVAWKNLVANVGEREAAAVARRRLSARDPRSLINWKPIGGKH